MEFKEVREFFESWGLYPEGEECGDYNPEVIKQGINRACYNKMLREMVLLVALDNSHIDNQTNNVLERVRLDAFVRRWVDVTDDAFYLNAESWHELECDWLGRKGMA